MTIREIKMPLRYWLVRSSFFSPLEKQLTQNSDGRCFVEKGHCQTDGLNVEGVVINLGPLIVGSVAAQPKLKPLAIIQRKIWRSLRHLPDGSIRINIVVVQGFGRVGG